MDQRSAYFNTQVANPMAGLVPNSGLNNATLTRAQLSYAFPQYSQVTITDVPIGSQRYDSAQFKVTKRFSHGFTTTVAFTVGKALEQISTLNAQDVNVAQPDQLHAGKAPDAVRRAAPAFRHRHLRPAVR